MKSIKEVWKRLSLILLGFTLTLTLIYAAGMWQSSQWTTDITPIQYGTMIAGDFNNDGRPDLVISGCPSGCSSGGSTKVYISNGSTLTYQEQWSGNLSAVGWSTLTTGDINNDGLLDLILSGCTTISTRTCTGTIVTKAYTNNGTSLIENSTWQQNLTEMWGGAVNMADYDGDGKLDLAINGQTVTSKLSKIYINNGTSFEESVVWSQNMTPTRYGNIISGDIDNDGDIDLIISGQDSDSNDHADVFINNGTTFIQSHVWDGNLQDTSDSSLVLGDWNNDGWLDLILNGCCDYLRLYQNNKTHFIENLTESSVGLVGMFQGSLVLGDYDNDGDLDFASAGRESGRNRVYQNGLTNLWDESFYPDDSMNENLTTDVRYGPLLWIDLDNDTDLEYIVSGYNAAIGLPLIEIYLNNHSQVSNNTSPSASTIFQNYTLGQRVFFGWNVGSDIETSINGLYYNLRISTSTGGNNLISGIFGGTGGGGAGGGGANGYFGNMMQRRNTTLPLSTFQANTNYYWSVQTIDTGLAKSAWSAEQMFTTSSDISFPTIVVHEPDDSLYTNSSTINFIALAVDNNNITNVSLWANFTGTYALNVTNSSAYNNTNYTFTKALADGHYKWAIRACDALNNCNSSLNRTLNVDATASSVSLSTPSNASTWTSSGTVTFTWSATEANPSNCTLYVSDVSKGTTSASTLSVSLSNAAYTWYVSCTDLANNIARSSATRALTISYTPDTTTTTTGGGGGGGGGTTFTSKFDADLSKAEEKSITGIKGTIRTFTLDGTTQHKITLNDVTKDTVTLIIESQPVTLILAVGETKKVDLDQDGDKDIAITLNSIISGNAVITIKKLPPPTKPAELPKEELPEKPRILFDIKIKPLQKIYFPGENLQAEIELTNLGTIGMVDVNLNYILYNQQGQITAQHQDIRAVDTVTSFIQTLNIPENTPTGTYSLNVTAQYQNTTNQYSTQIQIQTKIKYIPNWIQKNYKLIAISSATGTVAIIAVITALILIRRLRREEKADKAKLEREIKKLRRSKK